MRPRVGTVGYLNARPLIQHLDARFVDVVADTPAGVADRLACGDVDVALVPVVAALEQGASFLPGWCIGADGPVDSVLLVAETPPESWTCVILDDASRTSQRLAELVLRLGPLAKRVSPDLVVEVGADPVDRARGSVASLVIGDAALALPPRLAERHDLAALWKAWTGLPFVFAAWATRRPVDAKLVAHLREAGAAGVSAVDDLPPGPERRYLQDRIRYAFDDAALCGLRRFAAMIAEHTNHAAVRFVEPAKVPRPGVSARWLERAEAGEDLPAEGWRALATEARTSELTAAADGVRRRTEGVDAAVSASFAVAWASGRPDLGERAAEAVYGGATRFHLLGEAAPEDVGRVLDAAPNLSVWVSASHHFDALARAGAVGRLPEPIGCASPSVRRRLGVDAWSSELARIRAAHAAGLEQVAHWVIGQGDDVEDRLLHLEAIAACPDWFASATVACAVVAGPVGEVGNTAVDLARWTALARLRWARIPRFAAAPTPEGLGLAQLACWMGCNDLGVVVLEGPVEGWTEIRDRTARHLADVGRRALIPDGAESSRRRRAVG